MNNQTKEKKLEMWANAQCDGRPAKYRWRPLFNAAVWLTPTTTQSGWRPLLECRAVMLPRCKTRWNLQTRQQISAASRPKFTILSEHVGEILLFKNFFSIVDTCLGCEDIARQSCPMVLRWRIFGVFFHPVFSASRMHHVSDLHLKFALRPHHVWKYGKHPICDGWD